MGNVRSLGLLLPVLLVANAFAVAQEPPVSMAPMRGFIENRGQLDPSVRFYSVASGSAVYFTDHGPVLELRSWIPVDSTTAQAAPYPRRSREQRQPGTLRRYALAIRFAGGNRELRVEGVEPLPGTHHYLRGKASGQRSTGTQAYRRVAFREVWPGIDVVYTMEQDRLTYEIDGTGFADGSAVRFVYEGVSADRVSDGVYRLETPLGVVEDRRPVHRNAAGTIRVSGPVDIALPAAHEPELLARDDARLRWGTFLGGAFDDAVYAVAVDNTLHPIVTGAATSGDFPTTLGAVDEVHNGLFDVVVSRFAADGTTLLWSTYLGGAADDRGWAIALDSAERPLVAGITSSALFPVTPGAFDVTHNGEYDAFVVRLAADGSAVEWGTYLGGGATEWDVSGLVLDAADRPVIAGSTRSSDLPTTPGAYDDTLGGERDAFAAKLSADGSALVLCSYLGGSDHDVAEDVAVDTAGSPVVAGRTYSADFPATPGAFQPVIAGSTEDGFVARLSADGTALDFATFLGGDGKDEPYAVALDAMQRILVSGLTASSDFPTTPGSFRPSPYGGDDAFVAKLAADGTSLLWGTYYGGASQDESLDLVLDASGRPVIVGWTCSSDLPAAGDPLSADPEGPCDGFLARFQPDGSSLVYSSYIGGWRDDTTFGVVLDSADRPIIGGETFSTNFPVTPTSYDPAHNSPNTYYDGFLLSLESPAFCSDVTGGSGDPWIDMGRAVAGACVLHAPEGNLVDLIEGQLDELSTADIGTVTQIACGSPAATFGTGATPLPGRGLFQLARFTPGGTYEDGAGTTLVGTRTPLAGDCPP